MSLRDVDKDRRTSKTRPARRRSSLDNGRGRRRGGGRLKGKGVGQSRGKSRERLTREGRVLTLITGPTSLAEREVFGSLAVGTGISSTSESTTSGPGGGRFDRVEGAFGGTSKQAVLAWTQAMHLLVCGVSSLRAQTLFLRRQASH